MIVEDSNTNSKEHKTYTLMKWENKLLLSFFVKNKEVNVINAELFLISCVAQYSIGYFIMLEIYVEQCCQTPN